MIHHNANAFNNLDKHSGLSWDNAEFLLRWILQNHHEYLQNNHEKEKLKSMPVEKTIDLVMPDHIAHNLTEPWFLLTPKEWIVPKMEEIRVLIAPELETSSIQGTSQEKYQKLGFFFLRSFLRKINSGVNQYKLRDIYVGMMEWTILTEKIKMSEENIQSAVNTIKWITQLELNKDVLANLYDKSKLMANGEENKTEICIFALLNTFTQVTLTHSCVFHQHLCWVPCFSYVFYNHFLSALSVGMELQKRDDALNIIPYALSPPSSRPSSSSTPVPTNRLRAPSKRGNFPEHVRKILDELFKQTDGQFEPNELAVLADRFKDHMTLHQIRVYFKNMRAKKKKRMECEQSLNELLV
ncbi:Protein CBG27207 [Caenorhabditis briggsae]|uniref:Protein CBG27207 n=2 Tax=Caenorhabditis briggsae TaxID=6238 RepID=B6IL37_CAEBR|nr:Protein CBG27207 [Caenorhabditis briggsae]CAS00670.1 Protein CBG27207 [Caenorhabditis briggsae]